MSHKVTTVIGAPGIGKTTISKAVGFHLVDRKVFKDGVVFFSMKERMLTSALIEKMYFFFSKHDELRRMEKEEGPTSLQRRQTVCEIKLIETEKMKEKIFKLIEDCSMLIIIDNLEDCLRRDADILRQFIIELLTRASGISIMSTSRSKINDLGEVTEKLHEL